MGHATVGSAGARSKLLPTLTLAANEDPAHLVAEFKECFLQGVMLSARQEPSRVIYLAVVVVGPRVNSGCNIIYPKPSGGDFSREQLGVPGAGLCFNVEIKPGT